MISLALIGILVGGIQGQGDGQADRRSETGRAYAACVEAQAVLFEPAGEPLSEIVQSAFVACGNQEGEFLVALLDNRERTNPSEPREQREAVALRVLDDVKTRITEDARLAAMRRRASRNLR